MRIKQAALVAAVVSVSWLALSGVAGAQDAFPDKPVTIVVPWPAGTVPDVALRVLAELASEDMGQPIVVTNVEGGGGTKGMNYVANQPADGYTIVNNWVAPQTVAKIMNPDVGFSDEDFAPIGGFIFSPFMLMVAASHPANNAEEFVDWAKGQDRSLNVGVCAALSVPRMVMEEFLAVAEIENYNPVPYPGCNADNHKGVLDGSLDFTTADMAGVNPFGELGEGSGRLHGRAYRHHSRCADREGAGLRSRLGRQVVARLGRAGGARWDAGGSPAEADRGAGWVDPVRRLHGPHARRAEAADRVDAARGVRSPLVQLGGCAQADGGAGDCQGSGGAEDGRLSGWRP